MGRLEKRHWKADLSAYGGRKARSSYAHEAYVPDDVAELAPLFPGDIAEALTEADRAIVELNRTPPAIDDLEALARQLLRAESVGSSRIEGIELSHRRLAKESFAPTHTRDVTAQEILGNIQAMERAVSIASARSAVTVDAILAMHRDLLGATRDRHLAGVVRTTQNWIGGASDGPRAAEFIPPPPELVPDLLVDLCEFTNRDDLPAVAQAAIAHAQFETIHPFADGNGRVGRCLIHVVLRRRAIAPRYVPPISIVLAGNSRAYSGGLGDFRAGRVAEWCGVFAAAARTAAVGAAGFAGRVAALQRSWLERAGRPRADSSARRLVAALPAHPILDVRTVESSLGVSDEAARLAVERLEGANVLKRCNVGRRNRAWEAVGLFELLNAFEKELLSPKRP